MHSCLYEGTIRHRRFQPVANAFRYRVFLVFLDLAELDHVFDHHRLWSTRGMNLAYLRRRDYMGDPGQPLEKALRGYVEEKTGERPTGPIRMLAHLRYFAYCFNPVVFYYCYDPGGNRVDTIVTQIHNTPWGEEHLYVLHPGLNEHPLPDWRRYRFDKAFHVSPFMDMDIHYDWRFRVPGERINVHMINLQQGRPIFDASLALQRRAMSHRNLSRVLIAYPLMTLKVAAMIYWQALRLLVKKAPFYEHPKKRSPQLKEKSP